MTPFDLLKSHQLAFYWKISLFFSDCMAEQLMNDCNVENVEFLDC